MKREKEYPGIDWFRLPAALMVIAIHTAPFSKISGSLDFLLTYCLGRVAVPFFLMTTGYFVLAPAVSDSLHGGAGEIGGRNRETGRLGHFLKKNILLYLAVSLLYLPLTVYAGNLPESLTEAVRDILFDGTFYHLWYFPAVILGSGIVYVLLRVCSLRTAGILAVCAYLAGLFGDSLYGAVQAVPVLRTFYGAVFSFSSYTRNGIFYAPVFLLMGVVLRRNLEKEKKKLPGRRRRTGRAAVPNTAPENTVLTDASFLAASAVLMMMEGDVSFYLGLQRHNSMYLFLLPVMYFLYRLLLRAEGKAPVWGRSVSMIVYVIHPAVIVALRGAAGAAGLEKILVENPLMQFLCVGGASFAAALAAERLMRLPTARRMKRTDEDGGSAERTGRKKSGKTGKKEKKNESKRTGMD